MDPPTLPWHGLLAEAGAFVREGRRVCNLSAEIGSLPRGDGHPVLVIPAFVTSDLMTASFRRLLGALGYAVEGWGAGLNLGPTPSAWAAVNRRLVTMANESGEPVSSSATASAAFSPALWRAIIRRWSARSSRSAARSGYRRQARCCRSTGRCRAGTSTRNSCGRDWPARRRCRPPRSIRRAIASSLGPAASTSRGAKGKRSPGRTSQSTASTRRC